MGIDLEAMRRKLAKSKGGNNTFLTLEDGDQNLRILPLPDGDPFKEFHFHYRIGEESRILCPQKNFGEECAICDFVRALYESGDKKGRDGEGKADIEMAKDMSAKKRFYSAVVVRGQEKRGVRTWGYSKTIYEKILRAVLNPDIGDITDPEEGYDLEVNHEKVPSPGFNKTSVEIARRQSPLCDPAVGAKKCAELLESVPDFDMLFERIETSQAQSIMDAAFGGEKEEIVKYGADEEKKEKKATTTKKTKKAASVIDKAFEEAATAQ